jgi:steroid delta-isomerase-like uncharacterized protein
MRLGGFGGDRRSHAGRSARGRGRVSTASLAESNKAIVRRHFDEVLNEGAVGVIDEIYADGYVLDAPVTTDGSLREHGETRGREGLKRRVDMFRAAFPDIHFVIEELIAEGERVAVQYTFCGTHAGVFGELQPTGRRLSVTGILVATLVDGRIERAVSVFDSGDMLNQLNGT